MAISNSSGVSLLCTRRRRTARRRCSFSAPWEVTATILTRLEDYFGIPYPCEKADQVAVPVTVGFGAMENPGMVTYGQNILLARPAIDTISRQRNYANIAAHELSHQWFGDLVTTAWWDDIWLNEAFATWMEQKLLAEWKPEWKTRVDDVDTKLAAEDEDSLVTARQIRQPIQTKDDIANAFDSITYKKGRNAHRAKSNCPPTGFPVQASRQLVDNGKARGQSPCPRARAYRCVCVPAEPLPHHYYSIKPTIIGSQRPHRKLQARPTLPLSVRHCQRCQPQNTKNLLAAP